MDGLFFNCHSLLTLPDISKWNTLNVTDMSYMFYNCKAISSLPNISKWDIQNVTNMCGMFAFCESLQQKMSNILVGLYIMNLIILIN